MMGNSRTDEKGKAPAFPNSLMEANNDSANGNSSNSHPPSLGSFLEGNLDDESSETVDFLLDMPFSFANWEDIHQSAAQGIPETNANTRENSMNLNTIQNPENNLRSNTVNKNLQDVPLSPDWNRIWGQQCVNQGHSAISASPATPFRELRFGSFNRPQVNRDITGSSFLFHPRETAPVNAPNDVGSNQSQSGIQGNFEGSFLSLGIGGTEEVSNRLKEAASTELKMARARKAMNQTLDAGFTGFQSYNSGLSNHFFDVNQMTSTNNEVGYHGSLSNEPCSTPRHILQMQQNEKNKRSGDWDQSRVDRLKEALSNELKTIHARKATGQTSGQLLNTGFMGFHSNTSGFTNQFSNMDQMTSNNNEVGVLSTSNSGLGSSLHHTLQMQQNDSRNIRSGDLDHYRAFIGNQSMHSRALDNLNIQPELAKPSWLDSYHTPFERLQHTRSTTTNSPNHAGQVISQSATPSQVLEGNMFFQRPAAPQVSWADNGPAGIDAPFSKRLGVEFNATHSLQTNQRRISPVGTNLQTTSTGRSQNVLFQLARGPEGSTYASAVIGESQKPESHIRPHHKRSAVVPQSASQWVQRQKIIHPGGPHYMPKSPMSVTTAQNHPTRKVRTRAQPASLNTAYVRPGVPSASNVKPHVPVTTAPAVAHITRKDPEATPKLSGYKCLLCKRDLALTSEGQVFQPAVPPPIAVLPCGHTFHDQCLQNITPADQAKDPPCIPCAIGEQ